MRRWLSERLDEAMLPFLKLISRGYRERLGSYQPPAACSISVLGEIQAPQAMELQEEGTWRGCRAIRYRFASPVDCLCAENEQVSGLMLEVDSEAPWVLIIPGFATGALRPTYSFFQDVQGRALIEQGVNVALIDTPYHMLRKRQGHLSGEGFFSPNLAQTQNAVLQGTADAIALVRWLQQHSGRRVGLWGTSLGGCLAGMVATQVDDLAAVALMEPMDNPGDLLASLPGTGDIREEVLRHGMALHEIPQALRAVAPSTYPPAVDPDRILFVIPRWDRVVPTRFQEHFWEAWGRPQRLLIDASHVTTATSPAITAEVVAFLARRTLYPVH